MIHNLEQERNRIEEALDILRRLHRIRKSSNANREGQNPEAELSRATASKDQARRKRET
jgi:hypothetical protein